MAAKKRVMSRKKKAIDKGAFNRDLYLLFHLQENKEDGFTPQGIIEAWKEEGTILLRDVVLGMIELRAQNILVNRFKNHAYYSGNSSEGIPNLIRGSNKQLVFYLHPKIAELKQSVVLDAAKTGEVLLTQPMAPIYGVITRKDLNTFFDEAAALIDEYCEGNVLKYAEVIEALKPDTE